MDKINYDKNILRHCPHCVKEHGWPKGSNTKQERKKHKEYWEADSLGIVVLKTEREPNEDEQ